MKVIRLTEAQARRSWTRLLELQQRGYTYLIKRRGRVIARLSRAGRTADIRTPLKIN